MSGAEGTLLSSPEAAAAGDVAAPAHAPPRRRLFGKYALLLVALVGGALLITSGFDFWFSYQETKAALIGVQQEKAQAAAARIGEFVAEIERQIGWTTHAQWAAGPLDQRREDYFRLLRQVPAITELSELDGEGREQLKVSRLAMDVVGSGQDFSHSLEFTEAKAHGIWFGPVYFKKQSEPYMTLAIARDGRNAGVTIAQINLKLIWDVITALKIGEGGYAYVVDRQGRLIADPDISLVLRDTDLSHLPQVAAALHPAAGAPAATVARNIAGHAVLTAHAAIGQLGWLVFVEVPLKEALAPLYGVALRTALLLVFGLIAAALVALVLARRMTGPIRAIAAGAERIGQGELDRRIAIHTGDELEGLAGQFNRMADDLQKSYAELEQRVRDRTAELSEALDQQTATAEVLGVINASPGDLAPVFDAMLEKAIHLCEAAFGTLWTYDGECFRAVTLRRVPGAFAELLSQGPYRPEPGSTHERLLFGAAFVEIDDIAAQARIGPVRRALVELGGARTLIAVPLLKDGTVLGAITAYRQEVRPFTDKQIALLQNFAAQAVIAMENARLITETREALEQQTATAEVLQVINASPGDLAPVFDAMLEKAMRLCGAAFGFMMSFDGERFRPAAQLGVPPALAAYFAAGPDKPGKGEAHTRVLAGEDLIHSLDYKDEEAYRLGNPLRRAVVDLGGARTALVVALRKDQVLLGTFTIYRQEVRPFSDKQIALLQNFAAQAVIAMENARLITETREALEQQTATAEVLQVINSSPGDLAPVFDAMLDKAMRLCEAAHGHLFIYSGDQFAAAAIRGDPSLVDWMRRRGPVRPQAGGRTPLALIISGEDIVHVADALAAEYDGHPDFREQAEVGGFHTLVTVALRKEDRLLGAITVYRQEVRPFSDKQIALLQNFAAQAVIAMENARLITETREALDQQTATAEVLQVINSSPGDLAPVFDAILDKALRLCGAAFGMMNTYDGERFQTAAVHSFSPALAEMFWRDPPPPGPHSPPTLMVQGSDVISIDDLTVGPGADLPRRRALIELGGARSYVAVALRTDGKLLGTLGAYRQEQRPFSDKEIVLLQNFAAQAVIAMENARLITETRERTRDLQLSLEYQTATSDVLKVISRSPIDIGAVLDFVCGTAARLCQVQTGSVFRLDGGVYRWATGFGLEPAYREVEEKAVIAPGPGTLVGRVALAGQAVHIIDAMSDPLYEAKDDLRLSKAHTILGVPLLRDGVVIGVICLARFYLEAFTDKQIELVTTFADQAVIAIENVRLFDELRERTRDLQESLEYQTATSDVLKVISQSTFDLEPVLTTVAETAARLCDCQMAFIFRRDGEIYRLAVSVGFPAAARAVVEVGIAPGRGSTTGRAALTKSTVHVPDARSDPEYTWSDFLAAGGTPTMLSVPLLRDGEPVGVITLGRERVEPFSDKQIALVTTFADQAVIAIENARLFNELRERTDELARSVEELQALSEVGQAVSSTLDVRAVLSTILGRSVALAGAEAGAIFRYRRGARAFRLFEAVGWDERLVGEVRRLDIAETVTGIGEATAQRRPLQIADLATRPSTPLRDATVAAGYGSVLIVPLVGADRVFGAIVLQRRAVGEFPEATVRLMQTLASQSVLAIQNARLFNEIAEKSEQLAEASRHKSQFLANMSHELRTPLNAILGYTELLADGIYGELAPRAAGVLERVQNNGKHLLALINDVLDLAKIEAGQLSLTLEDYAMPDVVRSVVSATEGLANTKGLKFTADIMPGLPTGHGDARRLSQVLLNLVGNAVKFTDKGEVAIGATVEDGHFVLSVRDTGPGIAAQDHGKIFEEFQQVDSSNTRKKGGTGLGLAISKRMVEMQGGSISVASELGHGATFRVTLPIRVEEIPGEPAEELMGAAE